MRKLVGTLTVAALCLGVVDAASAAGTGDMVAASIPGTDLALDYPAGWSKAKAPPRAVGDWRDYLEAYPEFGALLGLDAATASAKDIRAVWEAFAKDIVLVVFDPVDGDNVMVSVTPAEWWSGLEEWEATGKVGADATDATVLFDVKARVNGRPAFKHLERDADGVYALMEIKHRNNQIVSIGMSMNEDDPAVAQAIMDGVHRKG